MNKYYVFARYRLPDYVRPDNCNSLWSGQGPAAHSLEEQGGKTCPWLITITLALVFCLVGCATPIGVKKVGMRKAYQEINANVLTGEGLSDETKIVLHRFISSFPPLLLKLKFINLSSPHCLAQLL